MRLTVWIEEFEMDQVILELGLDANFLPKKTWERMGQPKLQWSPIQLHMMNQQKIIPIGQIHGVIVDIEEVSVIAYFEVIDIIDDSNPYPNLIRIDWPFDMDVIINLK